MKYFPQFLAISIAWIIASALSLHAAQGSDPIVGNWSWLKGCVVTFNPNGTYTQDKGGSGKWECIGVAPRKYVLKWAGGRFVDNLTMRTKDGQLKMDATNNVGAKFTVSKNKAASAPAGAPPSSRPKNQIDFVAIVGPEMNGSVLAPLEKHFARDIRPSLLLLRDNLLDEQKEKLSASPETYRVAVRLVNAWLSALDEREKRRSSLGLAAPPVSDLAHSKKTVLHYWDDILMFERELKDAAEFRETEKQKKRFFKDAEKNNWKLRTDSIKPDLENLYSQFRSFRRESRS